MKNLVKILPLIALPFLSTIDSKAQDNLGDVPFTKKYIDKKFWNYQTKGADILRRDIIHRDLDNGYYDERILLDIDGDSLFDVAEVYRLREINDSLVFKTPYPWAYNFFWNKKGEKVIKYEEWIDPEMDGINLNEWMIGELEMLQKIQEENKKVKTVNI